MKQQIVQFSDSRKKNLLTFDVHPVHVGMCIFYESPRLRVSNPEQIGRK